MLMVAAAVLSSQACAAATYQLIDSGGFRRLERLGGLTVARPCPSASWMPGLPPQEWQSDLTLTEDGVWEGAQDQLEEWRLDAEAGFSLGLWPGENGQLGAFPEQRANWRWLRAACEARPSSVRVLNLFGYTGGSSLACAASGNAEVTHLDGAKAAVTRARSNAELSGLAEQPVRWIVDDVLTFAERAVRRGDQYDAIVLDPPAFGRGGPKKRDWRIERDLPRLLELTGGIARTLRAQGSCREIWTCA